MRRAIVFFIILSFSLNSFSADSRYYYVIKQNEVVSNILYRAQIVPIYGKDGKLYLLQKLNSDQIADLNKVKPGQKIYFPFEIVEPAKNAGYIEVRNENQIVFLNTNSPIVVPKKNSEDSAKRNVAQDSATNSAIAQEKMQIAVGEASQHRTVVDKKEDHFPEQSRLVVSLGSGYSRVDSLINSTGANAVLLSRPLISGEIRWEHIWSEKYESLINLSFTSIPYQDASQGQVFEAHPSLSATSIGIVRRFDSGGLSFEAGVTEEIIVNSYQMGTATVELKPLTFLKPAYYKDLVQVRNLKLTAGLGFGYYLASSFGSYQVDPSIKYLGSVQIAQKFKNFSFFALGEYLDFTQKTSVTTQRRREVKANFGFIIPLGESKP